MRGLLGVLFGRMAQSHMSEMKFIKKILCKLFCSKEWGARISLNNDIPYWKCLSCGRIAYSLDIKI